MGGDDDDDGRDGRDGRDGGGEDVRDRDRGGERDGATDGDVERGATRV